MPPKKQKQKMKQFNFSKLPLLALENVVDYIELSDIIGLSLCSKKTATAFRSARNSPKTSMEIKFHRGDFSILLYSDENIDDMVWWDFFNEHRQKKKLNEWTINGIRMKSRLDKVKCDDGEFAMCYESLGRENQLASYMNAVISHLLFVLPNCDVDNLSIQFGSFHDFQFQKAVASIKTANEVKLDGQSFNIHAKYIMSNIEVTEAFINEDSLYSGGQIRDKLRCSKELICGNTTWMMPEALMNLNCEYADLKKTRFSTEDIMNFLRKWKNSTGDDMKNIKFMMIEYLNGDEELDFEELEGKVWDPEKRAQTFKDPLSKTYDCAKGIDIERADGLMATVCHTEIGTLWFCVWHERFPAEKLAEEEEEVDDDEEE